MQHTVVITTHDTQSHSIILVVPTVHFQASLVRTTYAPSHHLCATVSNYQVHRSFACRCRQPTPICATQPVLCATVVTSNFMRHTVTTNLRAVTLIIYASQTNTFMRHSHTPLYAGYSHTTFMLHRPLLCLCSIIYPLLESNNSHTTYALQHAFMLLGHITEAITLTYAPLEHTFMRQ
jgi:hypothetical protein